MVGSCEHRNKSSVSIKCGNFLNRGGSIYSQEGLCCKELVSELVSSVKCEMSYTAVYANTRAVGTTQLQTSDFLPTSAPTRQSLAYVNQHSTRAITWSSLPTFF